MAGESNKDFVDTCIDAKLRATVYTTLPGVVTKVHKFESNQVVNVRPTIGRLFVDGKYKEPPEILNAPVQFPSAGGGLLSFPIKVGDPVMIHFSMRDMDNWSLSSGAVDAKPTTSRHYSLTDAIVVPGLYTRSSHLTPDPDNVVLKFAGSRIQMEPDGDVVVVVAKDLTATVANDATVNVGHDLSVDVGNNLTATVGGDAGLTVTGDLSATATNVTVNASGTATVSSTGDMTLVSAANISITAGGTLNLSGSSVAISGSLTNDGVNVGSTHKHGDVAAGTKQTSTPV